MNLKFKGFYPYPFPKDHPSMLFNPSCTIFLGCIKWAQMPGYFLLLLWIAVVWFRTTLLAVEGRETLCISAIGRVAQNVLRRVGTVERKSSVCRRSPLQQRSNIDPRFLSQGLDCRCHHPEFHGHEGKIRQALSLKFSYWDDPVVEALAAAEYFTALMTG